MFVRSLVLLPAILLIACAAPAATPVPSSTVAPVPAVTQSTGQTTGGGLKWARISATNPGPAARHDHTLVLDPVNHRLVVFGGRGSSGTVGDTWVLDLKSRSWNEVKTSPAPAARHGHTAIYDAPRRRMVIFSGQAAGFFNDVWAFDLERETWTELASSGERAGERPTLRYGSSAVFDSARNRMIISHGFAAGRFDDTWAFDLVRNSWTNITPSGDKPLKRCLHEAVYDAANDRMLLYGGCASGFGPCPLGDLWALDLKTSAWSELKPAGGAPTARSNPALVFDAALNRALVFGGKESSSIAADGWAFDLATGKWLKLEFAPNAPSARRSHDAVVDAANKRLLLFGGTGDSGNNDEVWELGF